MTPKEVQQAERLAQNAANQAAQDAWPLTPLEKEIQDQKDAWLMEGWQLTPKWEAATEPAPESWWRRWLHELTGQ